MDEHREQYEKARDFVTGWADHLNSVLESVDADYQPTSGKNAITRINNNLLYHPNKPTYKDHFGVEFTQGDGNSGFYIQIGTSHSFIGGGYHNPSKEDLNSLRDEIAKSGDRLKKIVSKQSFVDMFGELDDPNKLKTSPRGFEADHEHIDLLRFKSYAVMHTITQDDITSNDFTDLIVFVYEEMLPFSQYLNNAVKA